MKIIPRVYQITIRCVRIIPIAEEELTIIDTGFRDSSAQILSFIRHLGRFDEEIKLINNRYKSLRLQLKMASTNLKQAIESTNRIAQLDFDILCFGKD